MADPYYTGPHQAALGAAASGNSLGVAVWDGAAYPTRPSGFSAVLWIGPNDPGVATSDGDLWLNTT